MARSLPKRFRFPGGPWITIKEAPRADVTVAADKDTAGFYSHVNLTIWIDASLPLRERWRVLWHELAHALVDQRDDLQADLIKPWE